MEVTPELLADHSLTQAEYDHLKSILGRDATLLELGMVSLLWSEHCSYKSSRELLKTLPTEGPDVILGPGENAGVVRLSDELWLAFKVESHNHPSAVEPFNGAATGVGGIIRDVISMGARPVALADSLWFGNPGQERTRRLLDGVVRGVGFYGNCTGIPTVAGEVSFDKGYDDNPLVNALCVGLLPAGTLRKSVLSGAGNVLILAGGLTGPDGIHGATFASANLVGKRTEQLESVQVGDPFMEKLLIEAVQEAVGMEGLVAMQDLGAGGLSGVCEMAAKGGVGIEIDLARTPLRSELTPYEIILSESQERAVFCVTPEAEAQFTALFKRWGLAAAVIGRVTDQKSVRIVNGPELVGDIPLSVFGESAPLRDWPVSPRLKPGPGRDDFPVTKELLLGLLSHPTVADKAAVFGQYDYTVGASTVLPPGAADAAVVRVDEGNLAFGLTIDCNSALVELDPFRGAARAVLEAARNLSAVGAQPVALTNCLNFASPEDPEVYRQFTDAVRGLGDAARATGVPVVSGNVSFYNQSGTNRIPPTPVIGMVGRVEDASRTCGLALPDGCDILLLGSEAGEVGGSLAGFVLDGEYTGVVDPPDYETHINTCAFVRELVREGTALACHDCSEGGLAVALAEMAIAGGVGFTLDSELSGRELFGEYGSRFVVAVFGGASLCKRARGTKVPARVLGRSGGDSLLFGRFRLVLDEAADAYRSIIPALLSE